MGSVVCPKCMAEASITLDVNDGDTLRCLDCEEEYSLSDVEAVVESWARLLPWLKAHPATDLDVAQKTFVSSVDPARQ